MRVYYACILTSNQLCTSCKLLLTDCPRATYIVGICLNKIAAILLCSFMNNVCIAASPGCMFGRGSPELYKQQTILYAQKSTLFYFLF